jgi:hypothetical protein
MRAAEAGVSGTVPESVRVRKEYSDDECMEVEGHAGVTQNSLYAILSYEDACSSSER